MHGVVALAGEDLVEPFHDACFLINQIREIALDRILADRMDVVEVIVHGAGAEALPPREAANSQRDALPIVDRPGRHGNRATRHVGLIAEWLEQPPAEPPGAALLEELGAVGRQEGAQGFGFGSSVMVVLQESETVIAPA